LVAYGELLVGIALVIGAFTGIAAFFGAVMNWNFMMAGTASTNPVLFVVALGLIMAWKVSGYIGADFFLLPRIGTPWSVKDDDKGVAKMSESTSQKDNRIKN
jgi:thiosulfate dehydrogenase [quinone] large subunit